MAGANLDGWRRAAARRGVTRSHGDTLSARWLHVVFACCALIVGASTQAVCQDSLDQLDDALERVFSTDDVLGLCERAFEVARAEQDPSLAAAVAARAIRRLRIERRMEEVVSWADRGLEGLPRSAPLWRYLTLLAGEAERLTRRWSAASARLESLAEASRAPEHAAYLIQSVGLRGALALDLGQLSASRTLFDRELALAEALHSQTGADQRTLRTANLHQVDQNLMASDHEAALALCAMLLKDTELYPLAGTPRWQVRLQRAVAWAELSRTAADVAAARQAHTELEELAASAPDDAALRRCRAELAKLSLDAGALDEAARQLALAPGTSLRTSVLRSIVGREQRADLKPHHERLIQELSVLVDDWARDELREGGASRLQSVKTRALLAELAALDQLRLSADSAVNRILEVEAVSTLARSLGLSAESLATLRLSLQPGHGVLLYLPSVWRGSTVFAIDRDGTVTARLASYHKLLPLRRAWWRSLLSGPPLRASDVERGSETAERLAELLLPAPIREALDSWTRVSIVGLNDLPAAWLPLGDGEFLGTRYALESWPSLLVGFNLLRGADTRDVRALDVSLATGVQLGERARQRWPQLAPLPSGEEFSDTLADLYASERFVVVSGARATPRSVLELAGRSAVFQCVVHGVSDGSAPRPQGLLFQAAGEASGVVWCADIERVAVAPLMLLIACQSGTGPDRPGDIGSSDLAGACLRRGARAVVVADGNITWSAATSFTRTFHEALRREGCAPAEALRRVRQTMVHEHGRAAPWHDGLLRVVGSATRPLFEARAPRSHSWIWFAGLAVLIALFLGTSRRLR